MLDYNQLVNEAAVKQLDTHFTLQLFQAIMGVSADTVPAVGNTEMKIEHLALGLSKAMFKAIIAAHIGGVGLQCGKDDDGNVVIDLKNTKHIQPQLIKEMTQRHMTDYIEIITKSFENDLKNIKFNT